VEATVAARSRGKSQRPMIKRQRKPEMTEGRAVARQISKANDQTPKKTGND